MHLSLTALAAPIQSKDTDTMTVSSTTKRSLSLDQSQKGKLQETLDELAKTLPGCFLTVVTPTDTLFNGWSGKFDMLDPGSRDVNGEDVMWFASTTKLITSVCEPISVTNSTEDIVYIIDDSAIGYLTLVDRGILSLDTDLREVYPSLKEASKQILTGFDDQGQPKFVANEKPITLLQMLNQSSGFGMEFGETVQAWKKVTTKGKGFVNSCKVVCLPTTLSRMKPPAAY